MIFIGLVVLLINISFVLLLTLSFYLFDKYFGKKFVK